MFFHLTGSHGAGDDHETKTPYVIWGSGVNNPGEFKLDPETKGMSLENRLDINQVDLAPLMSTVLSIPVPVNSKVSYLIISFRNGFSYKLVCLFHFHIEF